MPAPRPPAADETATSPARPSAGPTGDTTPKTTRDTTPKTTRDTIPKTTRDTTARTTCDTTARTTGDTTAGIPGDSTARTTRKAKSEPTAVATARTAPEPGPEVTVGSEAARAPAPAAAGTPARSGGGSTEILTSGRAPAPIGPPTAPAEWSNFAPMAPRLRPAVAALAARTRRPRRVLAHEWTLAGLAAVALSALANKSMLSDPAHVLPVDNGDAATASYLLARVGNALVHAPRELFQAGSLPRQFRPDFPDALVGYAPFGLGAPETGAILGYTVVAMLAGVLAFVGPYALVRQLGAGWVAATAAGVAVLFAPWHLSSAEPMIGSAGFALASAMLAHGHGLRWRAVDEGPADPPHPAWAAAGWLVTAWQITVSAGAGTILVYLVLLGALAGWAVAAWRWSHGTPASPRLFVVDAVGLIVSVGVLVAMFGRYSGQRLTVAAFSAGSPPVLGLATAPSASWLWGDAHATARAALPDPAGMALLPGFTLYALAAAGVLISAWSWRVRAGLVAGAALMVTLTLGTRGPLRGSSFVDVMGALPGLRTLTRPAALIAVTTLLLAVLAAGAVGGLVTRAIDVARSRDRPRPTWPAYAGLLAPAALMILEGLSF